jgi:FkbM family methyltransferase
MTFKRLLRRVVPDRAAHAYRLLRTPRWRLDNELDDQLTRAIVRASVGSGRILIDVGASRGTILQAAVEAAPSARHVAFEPQAIAEELRRAFPSVDVRQCCVGATSGEVEFFSYERHTRSSKTFLPDERLANRSISTQVRLDDVPGPTCGVAVIKIDVEGHELDVLRGAEGLLTARRPLVVFEHGSPHGGTFEDTRDLFELFERLSYRCYALRGGALDNFDEFRNAVWEGRFWNFLAVPTSTASTSQPATAYPLGPSDHR